MILTTNSKLNKSLTFGYKSFGIHFAPKKLSGKDVCPHASKGCAESCLNQSGFGAYKKVQDFRVKKTQLFFEDRQGFLSKLVDEITTQVRRARNNSMIPCFRLNLTSDLAWEKLKLDGKNMMEHFPDVQFMDYCKDMRRMLDYLTGKMPKNYHLTFSRSEKNESDCDIVLGCGGNVAAVFLDKLPKTYKGKRVIDGDINDLRFLDKKKVIVGLVAKGKKAKRDMTGFVIRKK